MSRMAQLAFGIAGLGAGPARPVAEASAPAPEEESGVIVAEADGTIVGFNEGAERIFRTEAQAVIGTPVEDLLAPSLGEQVAAAVEPLARKLGPVGRALGIRADRSRFPVAISRSELSLDGRRLTVVVARDLSAREAADRKLRKAEARYRALVEQIPAVAFMAALEGSANELYVSPQIEALLGYTQEEWLKDPVLWYRRLHPDDHGTANAEFLRGSMNGGHYRTEVRFLARDGGVVWVHAEANVIRDEAGRPLYLQGVMFDITEIKQAELVVKRALREKEVLLKEIHHRVKNNMQVISSLLKLQSGAVRDPEVMRMFQEGQNRIRTMALVHEKLYRSGNQSSINFAEYARSLSTMVFRSSGPVAARVVQRLEIEPVELGLDVAVPLGLILNELMSNSLKHAFPGERGGEVVIAFDLVEGGYELRIRDDGRGFPPEVDWEHTATLGLQLVRTLTDQLGGTVALRQEAGTEFRIRFPRPA